MRGYHDVGGLPLGSIDRAQHDYALWEKRVDAMLVLLSSKDVTTVRTSQGKFQLRDEITQRVNGLLPKPGIRSLPASVCRM